MGSRAYLAQHGIDTEPWHERAEALRAEAKIVVFLAVDEAAVAIADRRKEANAIFEVGQSLRVGYRGYLDCTSEPTKVSDDAANGTYGPWLRTRDENERY